MLIRNQSQLASHCATHSAATVEIPKFLLQTICNFHVRQNIKSKWNKHPATICFVLLPEIDRLITSWSPRQQYSQPYQSLQAQRQKQAFINQLHPLGEILALKEINIFSFWENHMLFQSNIKTILTPSVCNYNPQCIITIHWGKHLSLAWEAVNCKWAQVVFHCWQKSLRFVHFPFSFHVTTKSYQRVGKECPTDPEQVISILVAACRQWQLTGSQSRACLQNTSTDEAHGQLKDFAELVMVISRTCPGWNFIFTYGTACY